MGQMEIRVAFSSCPGFHLTPGIGIICTNQLKQTTHNFIPSDKVALHSSFYRPSSLPSCLPYSVLSPLRSITGIGSVMVG